MDYRRLGDSGLKISRLVLGTMMFGRWGNTDHDDCVRIIHRALDEGDQLRRHGESLRLGRVGRDRRQGADGPARRVVVATKVFMPGGGGVLDRGTSRRHIFCKSRRACAGSGPTGSTSTSCTATTRHADRGDAGRAHRSRAPGQGALPRRVHRPRRRSGRDAVDRLAHGRVAVDQRAAQTSSASSRRSRPTRSSRATSSATIFPVCERFGFGAIVWSPLEGGWLAGRYRARPADRRRIRAPRTRPSSACSCATTSI